MEDAHGIMSNLADNVVFFLWLCGVHLDHDLFGIMENGACGWYVLQCY